jgi:hypothetical protein
VDLWLGDPQVQAACIGLVGAVVGACAAVFGQVMTHHLQTADKRKLDGKRKEYLRRLLTHRPAGVAWRRMSTLSRTIGASEEETARLLIEIGARGNTKDNNVWALIKDKPFPLYDDESDD